MTLLSPSLNTNLPVFESFQTLYLLPCTSMIAMRLPVMSLATKVTVILPVTASFSTSSALPSIVTRPSSSVTYSSFPSKITNFVVSSSERTAKNLSSMVNPSPNTTSLVTIFSTSCILPVSMSLSRVKVLPFIFISPSADTSLLYKPSLMLYVASPVRSSISRSDSTMPTSSSAMIVSMVSLSSSVMTPSLFARSMHARASI